MHIACGFVSPLELKIPSNPSSSPHRPFISSYRSRSIRRAHLGRVRVRVRVAPGGALTGGGLEFGDGRWELRGVQGGAAQVQVPGLPHAVLGLTYCLIILCSCSVACFKNHKDNFCQKTTPLKEVSKPSLQEEVMESNEIRDALKDSELQKMLLKIDGSTEPERELEDKLFSSSPTRFLTSLVHNNELQLSDGTLPLKSGQWTPSGLMAACYM
ncbi:hypothetical protein GUJ93_ZPchr0001g30809 [Zizania palustris]|uniref:Uncharacterized protein n=1 Tax=Zizania palustris TaxID=103762 RepID=A0A8J5RQE4_ZIZPA|nr:hypothetical protein GUJ93_ZPchr0001g30809 [Zizania palustris]